MLEVIFAFPTVIFTVLLGVVVVYWGFVVAGAVDLDLLGGGHDGLADGLADGAAHGLTEGAADGALDGAADGAAEGAIKGMAEGAAKGLAEAASHAGHAHVHADGAAEGTAKGLAGGLIEEGSIGFFASLGLRNAPVTVVFTVFTVFAWLMSAIAMQSIAPLWPLPLWLLGALVFGASSFVSLLITSVVIRPLARFFVPHAAQVRKHLVGSVCVISTGRVDETFGQATLEDGGAGFILQVRCDAKDALKRGDRALLVEWDEAHQSFVVEPMDDLLAPRKIATPPAEAELEDAPESEPLADREARR